jgi:hypothetical protein
MSDIKTLIQKLDEMTSGSVASVAMPMGETQKRVKESPEKSPSVDTPRNWGWGEWENKSLAGVKKAKNNGNK